MDIVYLTVIFILSVKYGVTNPENCKEEPKFKCGSSQETRKATVCKQDHNTKSVTIICLDSNITYYCRKARGNWKWDNTPNSSCLLNTGTTQTPAASKPTTTHETSTQTTSVITVTSMNQTHLSSDTTLTATTTIKETTGPPNQQNSSEAVTNQTHVPLETNTYETTETTLSVNTSDTTSSSASYVTTETSTYETTGTSLSVNTSDRTISSAPPFTADDKASVVAVAVSVSVVTVILVVLVVGFLLKRRQKSIPCAKLHTGNSFTNRSYEESHGLDRHISLLNIRSSQSVDNGYTEIPLENLSSEETSGNVYQTIDSLPENQTACNGNYGHLKMRTTAFVDNNYSHIPINQANGNIKQDSTYAHTGGATLKPDMEDKIQYSENTYNILETMHNMTTRIQKMDKQQESSTDDDESEYNHATAERSESSPESKADTYSHLNRTWQNQRANSRNDMKPIVEGSENQSHYSKADKSDNGKANLGKNNPEYAKCVKKMEDTENRHQVGSDGYEKASGVAHEYFILEPDNDTADKEASFHVIEDNFGDKPDDTEDAENPYHQYFTLERQINN